MNSLDSTKIKFSNSGILNDFNKGYFKEVTERIDNEVTGTVWKLRNDFKPLGLKAIELHRDTTLIEFSAKILGRDYFRGVNINTVEQVIDKINDIGAININSTMPDYAEILRCDVSDNLKVENVNGTLRDLSILSLNDKYNVTSYNRQKNKGIVFQRDVDSYKERQIFYNKFLDMQNPKNKSLIKIVNINDYQNILRCESNLTSFETIRKAFNLTDRTLIDVLNSPEKVNYKAFERVCGNEVEREIKAKIENLELFHQEYKDYKLHQIEKELGMRAIANLHNNDMKLIREFLKSKVSGKLSNYNRRYKQIIAKNRGVTERQKGTIEIIREMLKVA